MVSPDPDDAMVDHLRGALRRLGEAAPSRAAAAAALEEIEATWRRRPFTIAVMGEDASARAALLNACCGGGLAGLEERAPGHALVRVRRGTSTRFRATRRDGTLEAVTLAAPGAQCSQEAVGRAQVNRQELALLRAERAAARLARAEPPRWAFWRRMFRWLVTRRARARLAVWQRAKERLAVPGRSSAAEEIVLESRVRFFERLCLLGSGMSAGRDVREIELEVAGGPLADDVEVIELTGATPRTEVDLAVRVTASHVEAAGGEGRMCRRLGPPAEAASGLARLPIEARTLELARHARGVLIDESARLEGILTRTEAALRRRITRLEDLRVSDPESFISAQLARIHPRAAASIPAVLEDIGVHLAAALARRAARWEEQVQTAGTLDELRAAAARIDEEGVAESRWIAEETRQLVMGGVTGSAHDLLFELFSGLRHHELPEDLAVPPRGVPGLPPVAMLPSLAEPPPSRLADELGSAGKWLTGLFRSFDARRTELRDKVRRHFERVRAVAASELRATEPALLAALLEAGRRELSAAIERRAAWLTAEIAREQLAGDVERAELRLLAGVLDDARRDARAVQEWIDGLEAPRPALELDGPDLTYPARDG